MMARTASERAAAPLSIRRLQLSATLSGYIARQFALWFGGVLFGLLVVIVLASLVDTLDRLASKEAALSIAMEMALLKLPYLTQEVLVFAVLFAGLGCFWRLTRSNELVVARAAGISVWQVLVPVLGLVVLVGILTVTALNPLSAVLLGRFEQLEAKHIGNQSSTLAVSRGGLWLRQSDALGQAVIHARRATPDTMTLHEVTVFRFEQEDRFVGRIDASRAELETGKWVLYNAWQSSPVREPHHVAWLDLPTNLTPEKILESFAPPETISFWHLPGFIELLEHAGFTAVSHRMQFHRLLALPLLFAAMAVLAASFSLRPQRRGKVGLIIFLGMLTGFLLHFLSSFVFALGLSAKIPLELAAWTPTGVSLMLAVATLLYLEDG